MPWINKPPKKEKSTEHSNTDMRQLRQKAYNTTGWRKVRDWKLHQSPVCEECLKKGIVNAGSKESPLNVHHKNSPFKNGKVDYELLYDIDNLETLCPKCHAEIHNKEQGHKSPEQILAILDELLIEDNWKEE